VQLARFRRRYQARITSSRDRRWFPVAALGLDLGVDLFERDFSRPRRLAQTNSRRLRQAVEAPVNIVGFAQDMASGSAGEGSLASSG
jgi:hypothetical protein